MESIIDKLLDKDVSKPTMVNKEEYLKALEIVEKYHSQSNKECKDVEKRELPHAEDIEWKSKDTLVFGSDAVYFCRKNGFNCNIINFHHDDGACLVVQEIDPECNGGIRYSERCFLTLISQKP